VGARRSLDPVAARAAFDEPDQVAVLGDRRGAAVRDVP
jgi:hypothetical protein